jgi:apolipoprotein D and lipocalin family protein
MKWFVSAFTTALLASPLSAQQRPVRTVASVDLDRYLGTWFEIARYPNEFQSDCAGDVAAHYSRRDDGRIDVVNRCRRADGRVTEAKGVARVVDRRTFAKLEVRFAPAVLSFLPFVWGDYWIVGLAHDYSWAVVGSPDRKYLWILARTPALTGDDLESARAAARENGYEVERLVQTPQTAAPATRGAAPRV